MRKGQSSIEYLVVLGFALVVLLPASYLVFTSLRSYQVEASISQGSELAREIASTAENVYHHGPPSRLTFNARVPADVENLTIRRNTVAGCTKCTEVMLTLRSGQEMVASTSVDIRCDMLSAAPREQRGCDKVSADNDPITIYKFVDQFTGEGDKRFTLETYGDYVVLTQT